MDKLQVTSTATACINRRDTCNPMGGRFYVASKVQMAISIRLKQWMTLHTVLS